MNFKDYHFSLKMGSMLLTSGMLMFSAPFSTAWAADNTETVIKEATMQGKTTPKKRTITGVITDAIDGTPVIGATIKIKGQATGTISGMDGDFSLSVTSKDVLQISYVGYKTKEVPVEDLGILNIKLETENELLSEVVVVGAGTQKKVSVTGAITSVKGMALASPTSSLTNSFAGKLAGVVSTTSSGAPGEAANFYIRGIGTFGGRATPLIMLDDVEISAADLNKIPAQLHKSVAI